MFDQVYDSIYVGDVESIKRQDIVRGEGITAVVRLDLVPREKGQWDDTFALLDRPIMDGEHIDGEDIDAVTDFIHERIEAGEKVLVHCHMGISRSVTMVMAYLITHEGMSLAEAFGTVREGRDAAYPHEMLLVSLIEHYNLPFDVSTVYNPQFIAKLLEDA